MAFTHTWQQLLIVRIFFGIGIGLKGSTVPVYSAEVAPTVIRGALGMWFPVRSRTHAELHSDGLATLDHCRDRLRIRCVTVWRVYIRTDTFSAANAIVRNAGTITWRLQIGSAFIPAVPLAILIFTCEAYAHLQHRTQTDLSRSRESSMVHEERSYGTGVRFYAKAQKIRPLGGS